MWASGAPLVCSRHLSGTLTARATSSSRQLAQSSSRLHSVRPQWRRVSASFSTSSSYSSREKPSVILLPHADFPPPRHGRHFMRRYRVVWALVALALLWARKQHEDQSVSSAVSTSTMEAIGVVFGTIRSMGSTVWHAFDLSDWRLVRVLEVYGARALDRWVNDIAPVLRDHWSFFLSDWWSAPLSELETWIRLHPADVDASVIHAFRTKPRPMSIILSLVDAKFPPPHTYLVPVLEEPEDHIPTVKGLVEKRGIGMVDDPMDPAVKSMAQRGDPRLSRADTLMENAAWWRRAGWSGMQIAFRMFPGLVAVGGDDAIFSYMPQVVADAVMALMFNEKDPERALETKQKIIASHYFGVVQEMAEQLEWQVYWQTQYTAPDVNVKPSRAVDARDRPLLVLPMFESLISVVATPTGEEVYYKRPGFDIFMKRISERYDIAFIGNHSFEAMAQMYMVLEDDQMPKIEENEKSGFEAMPIVVVGREQLVRDRTTNRLTIDLKRLTPQYKMNKIVVLDYRCYPAPGQEDHWVIIPKWHGSNWSDVHLWLTMPFLEYLASPQVSDVRDEIRKWTERAVEKNAPLGVTWLDDHQRAVKGQPSACSNKEYYAAWDKLSDSAKWDIYSGKGPMGWLRFKLGLIPEPQTKSLDDDLERIWKKKVDRTRAELLKTTRHPKYGPFPHEEEEQDPNFKAEMEKLRRQREILSQWKSVMMEAYPPGFA